VLDYCDANEALSCPLIYPDPPPLNVIILFLYHLDALDHGSIILKSPSAPGLNFGFHLCGLWLVMVLGASRLQ